MSEKEYKIKCENLFKKNTILINQQAIDAEHIIALQKRNGELTDKVKELEKELTIKVKRLEDDCKAYNFTQHTLQEKIKELEAQIEKMKCCGNCRFSENDKLNGTFCHREGCFVVASGEKCKLWEN
jgi:hypothetical protein